jgi:GNAT superfamily N-acetyltransferase
MRLGNPDRPVGGLAVRPPGGVELRPAGRDDLTSVLRLLAERDAVAGPDLSEQIAAERWERVIGSVDSSPYLAVADGEPAGVLLLFFRRRLNFATWEAWVPELVVTQRFRRRGIGRALLRVALEERLLRGAHRLAVETASGEDAGEALLGGLGFDGLLRFRQGPITVRGIEPPPGVTIRPLQPYDFEAATRLVAEMGAARSPAPDRMDALERSFRDLTARSHDASLVAAGGDGVIGICTLELRETLRTQAPEAWIPELVVTEPMRGTGIGKALVDAALAEAASRGAASATLETGAARETAHRLYRSFGFRGDGGEWLLWRTSAG